MRKYDYSFLKEKHLNQVTRLSRLIAEINTKEILRKMQYEDVFNELRKKQSLQSFTWSHIQPFCLAIICIQFIVSNLIITKKI